VSHLRPYVPSLEGTAWMSDGPMCADYPCMLRCNEPTCSNLATHHDGSAGLEYLCCRDHCMCVDSYTSEHMYAPVNAHISISLGSPPDHEINLSEKKFNFAGIAFVISQKMRKAVSKFFDSTQIHRAYTYMCVCTCVCCLFLCLIYTVD